MRRHHTQRHFLHHTLEHLLGASFVFAIALVVGYVASAQESALTVTFSATPAPEVNCSGGTPTTEVFFVVGPEAKGSFLLSSDNGITNAPLEWGTYPLKNGTYSWKAVPNQGYTVSGESSGIFELNAACTGGSSSGTATFGSASVSTTLAEEYPETSLARLSIMLGTATVSQGGPVSGIATVSLNAQNATNAGFILESTTQGKVFFGPKEGVTHENGTTVWKLHWDSSSVSDGMYTLFAVMETAEGTVRSPKFSLSVRNGTMATTLISQTKTVATTSTPTSTITAATPPPTTTTTVASRVALKVFVNDQPVTDPGYRFSRERIELRVTLPTAKKIQSIDFMTIDTSTQATSVLGKGVLDDLLTLSDVSVWTYVWNAETAREGTYNAFARVLYADGVKQDSTSMPLTIVHRYEAPISSEESPQVISPEDRAQILARTNDPASCTNTEECKIFCASHPDAHESCIQFARVLVLEETVADSSSGTPSLADGISEARIAAMLEDTRKRPRDIPEIVVTQEDFTAYCTDPAHNDACQNALVRNDLASSEALEMKRQELREAQERAAQVFTERVGARVFVDTDGDGVSDYDEINIYDIDPSSADTDLDGFTDGAEILARTNPKGVHRVVSTTTTGTAVAPEEVKIENPLLGGVTQSSILTVSNVVVAEVGVGSEGTSTAKKLTLSGKAPANSFVTIFIFSNPIIVTVKTDVSGAWTYTLDKELPDGTHQLVSAITDSGGRILAKSEPLPFVKEAAAVSLGSAELLGDQKAPSFWSGTSLYALIAIFIALFGAAFSVIGFMVRKHSGGDGQVPPSAPAG